MRYPNSVRLLLATALCSCHSYQAMPVDLDEHLRAFRDRRPLQVDGAGLTRAHGRELAKMFHPDARLARRRAGVATVMRDQAGRWDDPQLQTNLQNILESVPYRWVAQAQLGFTVPINGRLTMARQLADRRRDEALVAAWATEQRVANELDRAWAAFSAAQLRVALFERTCANLEGLERIATRLVDVGSLTRPGARVFGLERQNREAGRALAVAEADAAGVELRAALGLHPDAPLEVVPDLEVAPFVAEADARRAALRRSPRLRARELAHHTAEADLQLQVRLQWPDLQLWPGWQEEDGEPRAGFGVNLTLPVLTANEPEVLRAQAERDWTAAAWRADYEQLLQELTAAEIRREAADDQVRRFEALHELAAEQVRDNRRLAELGQI
ncbi:MAG: TolC family protein, partial [Planctomycetes bacterium]|nr:TolC family protein [Planctomycetota bacterium]